MLVTGDVLGDVGAGTFAVAHLAEDTAAWAGDHTGSGRYLLGGATRFRDFGRI